MVLYRQRKKKNALTCIVIVAPEPIWRVWTENSTFLGLDAQKLSCVESIPTVLTKLQHNKNSCLLPVFSESFQSLSYLPQWGFSKTLGSHPHCCPRSHMEWITSTKTTKKEVCHSVRYDIVFLFLLVPINLNIKKMFHHQIYCFTLVKFQPHLTIY